MNERQLVSRLVKQLKSEYPEVDWYKPGDTFGGHKKPADLLVCLKGRYIAIEFKMEHNELNDNQLESRERIIKAGGLYLVGRFFENGKQLHLGYSIHNCINLKWEKRRYHKIDRIIDLIESYYK